MYDHSQEKLLLSFYILTLSAKDQGNIWLYGYFVHEDTIKLVINFLIKPGLFDRPLIRFNQ